MTKLGSLSLQKTALLLEVEEELEVSSEPQIVAMGKILNPVTKQKHNTYKDVLIMSLCLYVDTNMYLAQRFLNCMGQKVLMEAPSFDEAIINHLHIVFTLDGNYPYNMQATFEFFER